MHKNNIVTTLIVFVSIVIVACTQFNDGNNLNNTNLKTIFGKIVQTSDYCGGAAPTQEMIDKIGMETHFPDKELYIREGNFNLLSKPIIKDFLSDKYGKFEISLPQGEYCIIEKIKKEDFKIPDFTELNKQLPPNSQYIIQSEQCFKEWWGTCDRLLSVNNQGIEDFVIKFHHSCEQPCVSGGPQPP